jgi:Secretion system C-terminal sorting domain
MKKITLFLLSALSAIASNAADKTWIGSSGDAWNNAANWSGGAPGGTDNAIIDAFTGDIVIPSGTTNINRLIISGSSNVVFDAPVNAIFNAFDFTNGNDDIDIQLGSTLTFRNSSTTGNATIQPGNAVNGARFNVAGTLILTAASNATSGIGRFSIGSGQIMNIDGTVILAQAGTTHNAGGNYTQAGTINVNGVFEIQRAIVFFTSSGFNWSSGSTLRFKIGAPSFTSLGSISSWTSLGNVEYECSGQNGTINLWSSATVSLAGDLTVSNTNGQRLRLGTAPAITASGNFSVSGNSIVSIANGAGSLTVNGGFSQDAGTVDVGESASIGFLRVAGDVNQSGGTITKGGSGSTTRLELNGSVDQNLTLATSTGTPLLRINKAGGNAILQNTATWSGNVDFPATGKLLLGNNNLTVNGTTSGTSSTGWIVLDGTGDLSINYTSGTFKTFAMGLSTTSFDKLVITPSGPDTYTASVGTGFAGPVQNASLVVGREWEISRSGATTADIEFTPDAAATNNNAPAIPVVGHWNGATWDVISAGVSYDAGTWTATGISLFSPFIVGSDGGPALPLELKSFTGKTEKATNLLEWVTLSEKNVSHFEVERSVNGHSGWQAIGTVKAAGDSRSELKYEFRDQSPVAAAYYRLRSVDFDRETAFSPIVRLARKGEKTGISNVFPSPATAELAVQFTVEEESEVAVSITDLAGKVLIQQPLDAAKGFNSTPVNVADLPSGIYFVRIDSGAVFSAPVRFVKQ